MLNVKSYQSKSDSRVSQQNRACDGPQTLRSHAADEAKPRIDHPQCSDCRNVTSSPHRLSLIQSPT